jgi:hypothetical protein
MLSVDHRLSEPEILVTYLHYHNHFCRNTHTIYLVKLLTLSL